MENSIFRLVSLKVKGNKYLGDLVVNFSDDIKITNVSKPYTSVLIGPNGTGKSYLLRTLIDLFRELESVKNNGTRIFLVKGKFSLKYKINNDLFCFHNDLSFKIEGEPFEFEVTERQADPNKYIIEKNNKKINNKEIILPNYLIASSFMLTDKYPVIDKESVFYKYNGIRRANSRSVAGTSTYIRRTVDFISENINNPVFLSKLKNVLNFLGLTENLSISYVPRYKNIFYQADLNSKYFKRAFDDWENVFEKRKNPPWGLEYYKKHVKGNENLIDEIVNYLKKLNSKQKKYGSGGRYLEYKLFDKEDNMSIREDRELLKHIDKLNLLSEPELTFYKSGEELNYNEISSGEAQFFSTIISVVAMIDHTSLLFFDEPEICLHPNWQMKYVSYLKQIFKNYFDCHILIATHSHFLISDLEKESSSVISLQRNEKGLSSIKVEASTFGWSAEQILLDVFKVPTTRNYYIAERIGLILKKAAICENTNLDDYKFELLSYRNGLTDDDPLHYTITKIAEKFRWLD